MHIAWFWWCARKKSLLKSRLELEQQYQERESMFEGFEQVRVEAQGVSINAVRGGDGPPVLLLHGSPQTLAMWHLVAPRLAKDFTVVAPTCADTATPPSRRRTSATARTPSGRWRSTKSR